MEYLLTMMLSDGLYSTTRLLAFVILSSQEVKMFSAVRSVWSYCQKKSHFLWYYLKVQLTKPDLRNSWFYHT